MLSTLYRTLQEKAIALNVILLWLCFGLLGCLFLMCLTCFLWWNDRLVVLVPPTLTESVSISSTTVNASYLRQMAEYWCMLKLSVTPSSVEYNYGQLLRYVAPERYSAWKDYLLEEARCMKRDHIVSEIGVHQVKVHEQAYIVEVHAVLKKWVGERALEDEEGVWSVRMRYSNGHLYLVSMQKVVS